MALVDDETLVGDVAAPACVVAVFVDGSSERLLAGSLSLSFLLSLSAL